MDSSRDNPFTRFATFWWALGTFLIFGVLTLLIWAINHKDPETLEEVAASKRYVTKEEIFKAQATSLSKDAVHASIDKVAAQLVAAKPAAIEKPEQIVPKSKRALALASGGSSVDIEGINKAAVAAAGEAVDPAVFEKGKAMFMLCAACHGQNGEGVPFAGPPLAGSEWVNGPVSNLVYIGFRGIIGPITVAGKEYKDFVAGMAPMGATMTDEDYAAVLTYVRNSFGNKASIVKPEWVTAFRGEIGKPQMPTSELLKPDAK